MTSSSFAADEERKGVALRYYLRLEHVCPNLMPAAGESAALAGLYVGWTVWHEVKRCWAYVYVPRTFLWFVAQRRYIPCRVECKLHILGLNCRILAERLQQLVLQFVVTWSTFLRRQKSQATCTLRLRNRCAFELDSLGVML